VTRRIPPTCTGKMAADNHGYIDDNRQTAPTKEEGWQAGSRWAKQCSYLGTQDAPRKRREPSQEAGPWAGTVAHTTNGRVTKLVTKERWEKTKSVIAKTGAALKASEDAPDGAQQMNRKELERTRGFLNYVYQTYPPLTPFLKGFHLTIDGWREGRDEYGWGMSDRLIKDELLEEQDDPAAPKEVTPVPRFRSDIEVLKFLTQPEDPPRISVRPEPSSTIAFIFGDASGHGFGTSEWVKTSEEGPGDATIDGDYGTWTKEVTKKSSSNFRELLNLVLKLERMAPEGRLEKLH
jgi:hypothetical protein